MKIVNYGCTSSLFACFAESMLLEFEKLYTNFSWVEIRLRWKNGSNGRVRETRISTFIGLLASCSPLTLIWYGSYCKPLLLDFEKPLSIWSRGLRQIRELAVENGVDVSEQIRQLETRTAAPGNFQ